MSTRFNGLDVLSSASEIPKVFTEIFLKSLNLVDLDVLCFPSSN